MNTSWFIQKLSDVCRNIGLPENYCDDGALLLLAAAFILAIFIAQRCLSFALVAAARIWSKRSRVTWDDAFCDANVPRRAAHLVVAAIAVKISDDIFAQSAGFSGFFQTLTGIYFAVAAAGTMFAAINALIAISSGSERFRNIPVKGFFQALKVLLGIAVGIWVLSILSDKSPAYFLSGLGALMAIVLIVFKDALLGFTAGILISVNDLVRNDDWIEIPGTAVDGVVVDISLTTIKVRNWDNTIANVPAYTLISTAFKNWRGMETSGGRRIKRAINIDMQTVHFASADELAHWERIDLLKPYLARKSEELREANTNVAPSAGADSPANVRRLTNLGTFRAYCVEYLRANKKIRKDMTLIVRQLDPKPTGIPLEIYVFTDDTRWANYENIQSDIFDHLLAVISEFNLRPFQEPSGHNFEAGVPTASVRERR